MLCDNCGKEPAKVHYKEIKDDKAVEFNLCEKCAAEKGLQVAGKKQPFSISNILAGMAEEVGSSTARCQTCGLVLRGVPRERAAGLLGLLRGLQGAARSPC